MERVVVGLLAMTLLFAGGGHGRTDYIFVCQLASPSSGNRQFPSAQSLTGEPVENLYIPEALNRHLHFATSNRFFLTDFDLGDAGGDSAEPMPTFLPTLSKPVSDDGLKRSEQQFPSDGSFLGPFSTTGLADLRFNSISGLSASPPEAAFVAEIIGQGGEISTGDYSFLARFGGLNLGEPQTAEPPHVVLGPPGNGLAAGKISNLKLLLGLSLLALCVLCTLVYAWRRRRRRLRRFLRGPRRTTLYRSPSLPRPPGRRP